MSSSRPRRERWRTLDTFGAPPLVRHSTSAVVINDVLYIFGGMAAGRSDDLSCLDLRTRTWSTHTRRTSVGQAPPAARSEHSMTAVGASFFIFGGRADSLPRSDSPRSSGSRKKVLQQSKHVDYGDLFEYETRASRWIQHHRFGKGIWPSARRSHTLTFVTDDEGQKSLWLYGGSGPDYAHGHDVTFDDVLKLDLTAMRWEKLEPTGYRLPQRSGHTATLVGDVLFFIGGICLDTPEAATNVITLNTRTLVAAVVEVGGGGPGVRLNHCSVLNPKRPTLILVFGGREQCASSKPRHDRDVFALNTETLQWEPVATSGEPASVRTNHVMALADSGESKSLVIYGGMSLEAGGSYCDTTVHVLDLLITGRETRKAVDEEMRFARLQQMKQREVAFKKKLRLSNVFLVESPTLDKSWPESTAYNGLRSMLSVDELRPPTSEEVNWTRPQFPDIYAQFKELVKVPRNPSDLSFDEIAQLSKRRPQTAMDPSPSSSSSSSSLALSLSASMADLGLGRSSTASAAAGSRPFTVSGGLDGGGSVASMASLFAADSLVSFGGGGESVGSVGEGSMLTPAGRPHSPTPLSPSPSKRRLPGVPLPVTPVHDGPYRPKRFTAEQRRRKVPPPRTTVKQRGAAKTAVPRQRYQGAEALAAGMRASRKKSSFEPRLRPKTVGQIKVTRLLPLPSDSDSDSDDDGSSRRASGMSSASDVLNDLRISGLSGSRSSASGSRSRRSRFA